jgi:hypothetical protein
MVPEVSREARRRVAALVAGLGLLGFSACAGGASRVALQIPALTPLPGPAGSPRLAVRLLSDARDLEALRAREGWFLEYLPDEALEPGVVQSVTEAIVQGLRASGRFAQVLSLGPDEGAAEPFNPPRAPPPAELVLEGEVLAFYAERNTLSHPFFSLMVGPLSFPLAALSGLKLLPTPITPLLPVDYRANMAIQVRLRDMQTSAAVWEGTVEAISEFRETAAVDFFKGKGEMMREAASLAIRAGIEKLARQLPPSEWFTAHWPKRSLPGLVLPAKSPR